METLNEWLKAHPQVAAEMFESNHHQKAGRGSEETVCGFCLASHRFKAREPKTCHFCNAPLEDTRLISGMGEIQDRKCCITPVGRGVLRAMDILARRAKEKHGLESDPRFEVLEYEIRPFGNRALLTARAKFRRM